MTFVPDRVTCSDAVPNLLFLRNGREKEAGSRGAAEVWFTAMCLPATLLDVNCSAAALYTTCGVRLFSLFKSGIVTLIAIL
jgi:hypothetical protein